MLTKIYQFFKIRSAEYATHILLGIVLFRFGIVQDILVAYFIPIITATISGLSEHLRNTKENPNDGYSKPAPDWDIIFKVAKFLLKVFFIIYAIWELYNFYLWASLNLSK